MNSTSGVFKAHPGVISANSGVVEANPEAIEALESWMLTPELVSLTPGAVEAEFRESKKTNSEPQLSDFRGIRKADFRGHPRWNVVP